MLREHRSFLSQGVDVGGAEEGHAAVVQGGALILVSGTDVAKAEVVAEYEDNIGSGGYRSKAGTWPSSESCGCGS